VTESERSSNLAQSCTDSPGDQLTDESPYLIPLLFASSELGKQGGKSSNSGNQPDHIYKPKEHGGLKE
jgi:hypothetical protein